MSEEEKEAIKDTKDILKELDKHKDKDFIGRLYYKNKPIENILQILLNLIEKQQEEIEELKDTRSIFNMGRRSYKNEIENKIKAKIEEIDEVLKGQLIEKIRVYFEAQKEVLQSLLEKGN